MTYKVILTADESLMSNYGSGLFYGFLTTAPVGGQEYSLAERLLKLLLKDVPTDKTGRALVAPHGLRRVESALIGSGVVSPDEVVVVSPKKLGNFISNETAVIGISVIDPLGKGPASTTFSGEWGIIHREPFTKMMFRNLICSEEIRRAKKNGAKVVVGGPGAWQLDGIDLEKLGIDVLVLGEGEVVFPEVVRSILNSEIKTPAKVKADFRQILDGDKIPPLRGGTVGGIVEVSRGCGRGCSFCMPTLRKIRHRPVQDIVADVKTNIRSGQRGICLHAEDVLRYGSFNLLPDHQKVIGLFTALEGIEGIGVSSISHAAMASIAASPQTVMDISEILRLDRSRWMGFQTGIETGSPEILQRYMRNKAYPFRPEEWHDVVESAFSTCHENNWVPAATLMINLPGEKADDVIKTTELVEKLRDYRSLIVPLLFVPFDGEGKRMRMIEDAEYYHFELYRAVWRHDMHWLDELAKDYTRGNRISTGLMIKSIVELVRRVADPKVMHYLESKINELKTEEIARLKTGKIEPMIQA